VIAPRRGWQLSAAGHDIEPDSLKKARRQQALMQLLRRFPTGVSREQLVDQPGDWRRALKILIDKGWVDKCALSDELPAQTAAHPMLSPPTISPPSLNEDQRQAVDAVVSRLGSFSSFLLDGVTGSGKTEVYINIVAAAVAKGGQALILVPEIGLTPQLVARFRDRFQVPVVVMHSAMNDRQRLDAWLQARSGAASIVIGTRSALFTPLPRAALFIIDEEHDLSYKQQEGFRYHARDLAIMRARQLAVPIVLGSATPSLESLYNVERSRYQRLRLTQRAGGAVAPSIRVLDVRGQPMVDNLSPALRAAISEHLARGNQVLLFLNRRGFAPLLLCHDCGWVATCNRCDARMTLHGDNRQLRCHHCAAQRPARAHCPECQSSELRQLGYGTERMEQVLKNNFADYGVVRIDRDSTRRRGSLEALFNKLHRADRGHILVGTQMLAKGHHLPDITLVGILDADQGLFGTDFRACERMAQQIIQVAGRAGRQHKAGQVYIQTHHPDHPLLQTLIHQGYHAFAKEALQERLVTELPPYSFLALLRADALNMGLADAFLEQAKALLNECASTEVQCMGPIPAVMERRAGRHRAQLLVQAQRRSSLQHLLSEVAPKLARLKAARKVRWSIDVDPMEVS
ncbi:MAG: primosomal protein N', partial [Gammaproteobacteria bacterium]|nr:primosomal protein N' [Gammaproteobacteria bacterium]